MMTTDKTVIKAYAQLDTEDKLSIIDIVLMEIRAEIICVRRKTQMLMSAEDGIYEPIG